MSIAEAYNSWSNQYDSNENATRDMDRLATIETLSRCQFENVLELGCGTGKNTEWLVGRANTIIGLDFSSEMLNKAKSKISDPKVHLKTADLTKTWHVEDDFADLITSSLTLEHIDDLDHIFVQAGKKLKENGLFFISELHPFKQYAGSKARYETDEGTQELEVYVHHISDYISAAEKEGFQLIEIREWFDDDAKAEIPRLISFVFKN